MVKLPSYRRHSTGHAFVEWDKKRHYLPGEFGSEKSKAAYREFLMGLIDEPKIARAISREPLRMSRLILLYLEWAESYYPTEDRRNEAMNIKMALRVVGQLFPHEYAVSFGPSKLKKCRQALIDRGLSRRYINACVNRIRAMFKWAVEEELVEPSVLAVLRAVKGLRRGRTTAREPDRVKPVEWADVAAVCKHLTPGLKAMVHLQWHTGVRSESICELTPGQVDCDCDPWLWRPKHKNQWRDQDLVVFLGPKAQKVLAPYLDRDDDEFCFKPAEIGARTDRRHAEHYTTETYRSALIRVMEREKLNRWTPHQIRHTKATAVPERFGLEAAQAVLGHASVDATEIYAEKMLAKAAMVAEQLG